MSHKIRFKVMVGFSGKRQTINKIENNGVFKPLMISANRNSQQGWDVFFSAKGGEDTERAEEFLKTHRLNFTKA